MHPTPLDETDLYVLFKDYEDVFLFEKDTNSELWRTSMHGEATCGLIGLSSEWAVVGGAELIIWRDDKPGLIIHPDLQYVHDIRQTGENEINLLIDPWMENSAIWHLDINTGKTSKIRDFHDYLYKKYTEDVKW